MNQEDFMIDVCAYLERIAKALERLADCTDNDQIVTTKVS